MKAHLLYVYLCLAKMKIGSQIYINGKNIQNGKKLYKKFYKIKQVKTKRKKCF